MKIKEQYEYKGERRDGGATRRDGEEDHDEEARRR